MKVEDLLRYGNWSGPGYTAARAEDDFGPNQARTLTREETRIQGIDPYDNFVAKAHDLNEYAAEEQLRGVVASLGLITNEVKTEGTKHFYTERFKFGKDVGEGHRFVSFKHYRDRLAAGSPGNQDRENLIQAFYNYYMHISHSNCQFAIDYLRNEVNLFSNIFSGSWRMSTQLKGASPIFLGEAADAEARVFREVLHGIADASPYSSRFQSYLQDNFVSPMSENFAPIGGDAFKPSLTKAGFIAEPRDRLVEAGVALREAKQAGWQEKAFRGANSDGYGSAKALIDGLAAV
ncbi:MAG: hypothetical protein AAF557_14180 [Pseudomonadota bacterium]